VGTQEDVELFLAQKSPTIIVRAQVSNYAEKLKNIVELFPDVFVRWKKTKAKVFR
jgi:uncharacterized protein (UPF0333 family)